jgi:gas vesicle protein
MRTIHKVLIGAAIGAIVGILFAPNKGSINRRKLRRKGNQIKDKINDLKDGINEKIDTLKEDAEDMAMQSNGHYRK